MRSRKNRIFKILWRHSKKIDTSDTLWRRCPKKNTWIEKVNRFERVGKTLNKHHLRYSHTINRHFVQIQDTTWQILYIMFDPSKWMDNVAKRTNNRVHNERTNEWTDEQTNRLMNGRTKERTKERSNERTEERTNERTNGWTDWFERRMMHKVTSKIIFVPLLDKEVL